jgi:hypothetical protein
MKRQPMTPTGPCPHCADRGLVWVHYREADPLLGQASDLVMCDCRAGQWYRRAGEAFVREKYRLGPDQQVSDRECVEGETPSATVTVGSDFVAAGKTQKAKL